MILNLEQYLAGETSVQAMGAGMVGATAITVTLAVMHRRKRHRYRVEQSSEKRLTGALVLGLLQSIAM